MKILCVEGEYLVEWPSNTNHDTTRKIFNDIRDWCFETFGSGWGVARIHWEKDKNYQSFVFKRLYHAQWFILKYSEYEQNSIN